MVNDGQSRVKEQLLKLNVEQNDPATSPLPVRNVKQ